MPEIWISGKNYSQFLLRDWIPIMEKLRNEENKYIIMIFVKRDIIHFILVTLVAYIAMGTTVLKKPCISYFWPKIQISISIYTTTSGLNIFKLRQPTRILRYLTMPGVIFNINLKRIKKHVAFFWKGVNMIFVLTLLTVYCRI